MVSNLEIRRTVSLLDHEAEELARRLEGKDPATKVLSGVTDPMPQMVANDREIAALYAAVSEWLSEGVADMATRERLERIRRATLPLAGD